MATNAHTTENGIEQGDVAVDVAANDLVHIGLDSQGANHYLDAQRGRIIVTSVAHDEYTREGSSLVRRSLVAGADDIEHIQNDGDVGDLRRYIQFVAARTERDWDSIAVKFIDADALLADLGGA